MPRKTSKDGAAAKAFVNDVAALAAYWGSGAATPKEAAEGVAFSLLALLDGCNMASPGFLLSPVMCTDTEAKQYPHYKEGTVINETPRNYIELHVLLQGALDTIAYNNNNNDKPNAQ